VNSSGVITAATNNEPRFDYNPVTLACNGLLIEESRANLIPNSAQFNLWTQDGTSVSANSLSAPDSTLSADLIISSAGAAAVHRASQSLTLTASQTYTISVYAKAGAYSYLAFGFAVNGSNYATYSFDLLNGTVGTSYSSGLANRSARIANAGNGWYRCSVTATISTVLTGIIYVGGSPTATWVQSSRGFPSYVGDGTSGIYAWGAQFEVGASQTSYIPTESTALTRNADVATITGANFSSFWNAGVGGTTVTALPSTVSGTRPLVQFDDGTANEIIALQGNTTNPELYIVDGGTPQAQIDAGTIAANTAYRLAAGWATDACAASVNGGSPVLDGAATIPTVTQARLGSDGTNYLNGHLQTIEYYDRKPTNATLQSLSSSAGRYSVLSPVLNPVVQS
jgi:hypothetical protein